MKKELRVLAVRHYEWAIKAPQVFAPRTREKDTLLRIEIWSQGKRRIDRRGLLIKGKLMLSDATGEHEGWALKGVLFALLAHARLVMSSNGRRIAEENRNVTPIARVRDWEPGGTRSIVSAGEVGDPMWNATCTISAPESMVMTLVMHDNNPIIGACR